MHHSRLLSRARCVRQYSTAPELPLPVKKNRRLESFGGIEIGQAPKISLSEAPKLASLPELSKGGGFSAQLAKKREVSQAELEAAAPRIAHLENQKRVEKERNRFMQMAPVVKPRLVLAPHAEALKPGSASATEAAPLSQGSAPRQSAAQRVSPREPTARREPIVRESAGQREPAVRAAVAQRAPPREPVTRREPVGRREPTTENVVASASTTNEVPSERRPVNPRGLAPHQQSAPTPKNSRASRLFNTDFELNDPLATQSFSDIHSRPAVSYESRVSRGTPHPSAARGRGSARGRGGIQRGGLRGERDALQAKQRYQAGKDRNAHEETMPEEEEQEVHVPEVSVAKGPHFAPEWADEPGVIHYDGAYVEPKVAALHESYQGGLKGSVKHVDALVVQAAHKALDNVVLGAPGVYTDLDALFGTPLKKSKAVKVVPPYQYPPSFFDRTDPPYNHKAAFRAEKELEEYKQQRIAAKKAKLLAPLKNEAIRGHLPNSTLPLVIPPAMQKAIAKNKGVEKKMNRMMIQTARETFGGDYSRYAVSPLVKRNTEKVGPALDLAHRVLGNGRFPVPERAKALSIIASIAPYDPIKMQLHA